MTLNQFIQENTWKRASNYCGTDFSEYVVGPSQHRDSDLVDRVNFSSALEELGGESETVVVARSSHWGVGWVEQILVHKSDWASVRTLHSIAQLLESYPILDESSYFELQHEERIETMDFYESDFVNELTKALGLDEDADFQPDEDFVSLARYVYEYDCSYRGDEDAWVRSEDLPRHLKAMKSHFWGVIESNPWFQYSLVAMGLED